MARNPPVKTPRPEKKDNDPPPGIISQINQILDDIKQTPDQQKEKRRKTEEEIKDFIKNIPTKKKIATSSKKKNKSSKKGNFNEDDLSVSRFASLVATGNELRYKSQTEMMPPENPPLIEKMKTCMHVFSRTEAAGLVKVYLPSLFRTGFIDNTSPTGMYEVFFRYFESSAHEVFAEEITKAKNYYKTDDMKANVPLDELEYMYKASYKEWKEFMEKVNRYRTHIRTLSEQIDRLTDSQDLRDLICHPAKKETEKLFHRKLMMNAEVVDYNTKMIKDLQTSVINVIKQWNCSTKRTFDKSGMMYHLGQIASDIDWSNEEEVKQYYNKVREVFQNQIVPIDLQFKISKVIIVIINIMAEKGNQAWHAVFNPEDQKQSMAMSSRIHDIFIKDRLKPFYDLNGNRLDGKGYFPDP
jgi:hypothetical protein